MGLQHAGQGANCRAANSHQVDVADRGWSMVQRRLQFDGGHGRKVLLTADGGFDADVEVTEGFVEVARGKAAHFDELDGDLFGDFEDGLLGDGLFSGRCFVCCHGERVIDRCLTISTESCRREEGQF